MAMGLLDWIRRREPTGAPKLEAWRKRWRDACGSGARAGSEPLDALKVELEALGLPEEEIEIEREMLAGLEALLALQSDVDAGRLPLLETGHRVVGTDRCHFSAPCSMPDQPEQPSGRLILTNNRAVFAGGAKALTIPWHAVGQALHQDRDLILVRRDRESAHVFRCNGYADTLSAALIARTLAAERRQQRSV